MGEIIDFQKFKNKKEQEEVQKQENEALMKRLEQKEKEFVMVKISIGDISEISLRGLVDAMGENFICGFDIEDKDGLVKIDFDEISVADFQRLVAILKEKGIGYKVEKYEER